MYGQPQTGLDKIISPNNLTTFAYFQEIWDRHEMWSSTNAATSEKCVRVTIRSSERMSWISRKSWNHLQVTKTTEWSHNLVYVNKPNEELHFYVNTCIINHYIVRCPYYNSTFNGLLVILSRGKYFSAMDVKVGYWNIKLSEQSSYLTIFNTPFSRNKWNHLPFGLVSCSDMLQGSGCNFWGISRFISSRWHHSPRCHWNWALISLKPVNEQNKWV